jgi:CRP/FNR family transcriptional regulator, cyclic AMP receptor protein
MNELTRRLLPEHPFFENMDPALLEQILPCAVLKTFEQGSYMFRDGEEASQFFLIYEGKVALELQVQNRPLLIETMGSGGVIGWSWLFPPYCWHFYSKVLEHTTTITLDGKCLLSKCEEDSVLGYELMKRFSRMMYNRLHIMTQQVVNELCRDRDA